MTKIFYFPKLAVYAVIVEIFVFFLMVSLIGLFNTLAFIILKTITGLILTRSYLRKIFSSNNQQSGFKQYFFSGTENFLNWAPILFLVIPGFLSLAISFLMFFKPVRIWTWSLLKKHVFFRYSKSYSPGRRQPNFPSTIDLDKNQYHDLNQP